MIRERFAFIVIYCALFGFYPADSWAKISWESSYSSLELAQGNTDSSIDRDTLPRTTVVEPTAESADLTSESSSQISRSWALRAMGIASGAAIFLLCLLFRKPPHLTQAQTQPKITKLEPKPAPTKAANFKQSDRPSQRKMKGEQTVVPEPSPIAKNNIALVATPMGNIDVVRELIRDLQVPDSPDSKTSFGAITPAQAQLRRKAIWKLTETGDYRSIKPLLQIMPRARALDKTLILEAVRQIAMRSFAPANRALFVRLQNENAEIRLSAVRDLAKLYQFAVPAINSIAKMQSDPDPRVRQTATQILQRLNLNSAASIKSYPHRQIDRQASAEASKANLHLVAYLLADLDFDES